jgi:hypothetical protein
MEVSRNNDFNCYVTLFGECIDLGKVTLETYGLIFRENNGVWSRFEREIRAEKIDAQKFVRNFRRDFSKDVPYPDQRRKLLSGEAGIVLCDCFYQLHIIQLIEEWRLIHPDNEVPNEDQVISYVSMHPARSLLEAIYRSEMDRGDIARQLGTSPEDLSNKLSGILTPQRVHVVSPDFHVGSDSAVRQEAAIMAERIGYCQSTFLKESPNERVSVTAQNTGIDSTRKYWNPFCLSRKFLTRREVQLLELSRRWKEMGEQERDSLISKLFGVDDEDSIREICDKISMPDSIGREASGIGDFTRMNWNGIRPEDVEISEDNTD